MPMRLHPKTTEHNYSEKVKREALEAGLDLRPDAYVAHIFHDGWCDIYNDGYCNCDPDIEFERAADIVAKVEAKKPWLN